MKWEVRLEKGWKVSVKSKLLLWTGGPIFSEPSEKLRPAQQTAGTLDAYPPSLTEGHSSALTSTAHSACPQACSRGQNDALM